MTRDQFNADQGRLLLTAVVLLGLLLLLQPSGAPLGLTLLVVGAFIWFFAVLHAFGVLLDVLLRVLRSALSPQTEDTLPLRWVRWRSVLAFLLTILLGATAAVVSQLPVLETLLQLGLALVILAILAEWAFARPPAPPPSTLTPAAGEGEAETETAVTTPAVTSDEPKDPIQQVVNWFILVVRALWSVVEAFFMMFVKTATTLLPTSARLGDPDKDYNKKAQAKMEAIVKTLNLKPSQQEVMTSRWLDQINWTSNRANRERDANELIRWWQIILSASIPVIGILPIQADKTLLASLAGGMITILTSVQQFRRPEERWRHYRMLTERMHAEFWSFVNLDEDTYQAVLYDKDEQPKFKDSKYDATVYQDAFEIFSQKMTALQKEDFTAFFSQVAPPSPTIQAQGALAAKPPAGEQKPPEGAG